MNLAETRNHKPLVNKPKSKKAKKTIRKVAKKRGHLNRQYMKLRSAYLTENQLCLWYLEEQNALIPSTQIHHRRGRGQFLLDTTTWMPVSDYGHKMIHANPKYSYEKGYMQPRR
jgi:hypothetical protein